MLLSPGFRSAAAMAGWDEEALLLATVVVEDTPVRESRQHKRRRLRTPLSTTSTRKRAPRRKPAVSIPPVVLRLDDDDDEEQAADRGGETTNKETEAVVAVDGAKQIDKEGSLSEKAPIKRFPCMDRLREELSCAICLEICFEPSTTPCGHSNARSCTINTVLWNTIQLLFPEEVEARKRSSAVAATPPGGKTQSSSSEQNNSNTNISSRSIRRSAAQASSQVTERDARSFRRRIGPSQSEDAAMALRLQREEFRMAFQGSREQQLRALRSARANLRAAASMTVYGRLRDRTTGPHSKPEKASERLDKKPRGKRETGREEEKRVEVTMSMGSLVRLPACNPKGALLQEDACFFLRGSPLASDKTGNKRQQRRRNLLVVEAKGKRGMMAGRQFQRPPPPPLPKIEDDGNPRFVVFIRTSKVYLWYPLSIISGGTTAKIMVAAKDNFLGKYIYKDTIARNIAAVIYKDEKEIQKTAVKQYRVLRSATSFRYGYKLVENNNLRAAISTSDVIELPTQEELKTVLDKVKDFFGNATSGAKESFGKLTSLGSLADEESESQSE
ncbi:hypothetical protein MUK42_05254 [Musa troglodytarum]|nr:hypothetical protein MUK42_05254 [Musa troglodytarum]